eukprot:TCONS_00030869-protein
MRSIAIYIALLLLLLLFHGSDSFFRRGIRRFNRRRTTLKPTIPSTGTVFPTLSSKNRTILSTTTNPTNQHSNIQIPPIGEPYYVLGVGSACYSISTNQTTEFNDQARIHDKAIRYFITQNEQVNPGNKLFQYQHYDVCNSNDVLLDLLVDLLLNDTFTVLKNPSNKVGYPVPDWKYESKILVLLVYLNRQQFQLLVEVLSQTNILIMNLRESVSLHYNEYLLSSQWISDASIKNFGRYFKAMLQGLKCKYVTMVLLRKNPYHFELYRNILLNHQICLNIEIINKEDNVQDVIQKLRQDDQNGLIILLGDEDKQTRLLNNYGPSNQTWFVNENYSKNISSELGNVISFRDNTIMKYSSNMKGLTNFIMRSNLTNSLSELDYFSRLFKEINLITAFIKDELTMKNKNKNLK